KLPRTTARRLARLANAEMPSRVLAIDGDGIRGILPARVLVELEQLGGPISEQFDLIPGSRSGAIMALALSSRSRQSPACLPPLRVLEIWTSRAHTLFARPGFRHRLSRALGTGAPGGSRSVRTELERLFGSTPFGDAQPEVLVPTFDLDAGVPLLIRSSEFHGHSRPLMREVALASLSLPTHFSPVSVELGSRPFHLTHGGLTANNPSVFAYAATLAENQPASVRLLSLGTGAARQPSRAAVATGGRRNQRWPLSAAG